MTVDSPQYDMRYTILQDADFLRSWLTHPGMLHWFPMSVEREVEDAVHCWIGFCRHLCSLTATLSGRPCGIGTLFLMPYKKVAHHCLFKLIVDPALHRQGIGTSLVRNLKHLAKTRFHQEAICLETWEGNPIIALLKKQGFHEIVRQERFVKEGTRYYARILLECGLI
jgi:putative acetyltransferase